MNRYHIFTRAEWAALRASVAQPLVEDELRALRGVNDEISLDEVAAIYLPLARLLHLQIVAKEQLRRVTDTFLGTATGRSPFVVGVTGSVAVGKSTTARILQALLRHWPEHGSVDLVTTDGFLFPNAMLEARQLLSRKGFPESYDVPRLLRFVEDVKLGSPEVQAPVYSHLHYDIVPQMFQTVRQPDVVVLEGLNVLQPGTDDRGQHHDVADLLDFSIFLDADEDDILQWFTDRFLRLRATAFQDPASFFHGFTSLTTDEAIATAKGFWTEINGVNLRLHIAPTRERAHVILQKGSNHRVERVFLSKL